MVSEEAVIFKQNDCREIVKACACWHNSFHDKFHDEWKECPGHCSIEIRLSSNILTCHTGFQVAKQAHD